LKRGKKKDIKDAWNGVEERQGRTSCTSGTLNDLFFKLHTN